MRAITGVYTSLADARIAVERLVTLIGKEHVTLLTPLSSYQEVNAVPTTDDMPHVGGRMGGILGGALGIGTGLLLPGVGFALGVAAAALMGAGGSIAGYKAGDALDRAASQGLPVDELHVYQDALVRGKFVVIALVPDQDQEDHVRTLFEATGAESLDAARDAWWVGIRDSLEPSEMEDEGVSLALAEPLYRRGFEAALLRSSRDQSFEQAQDALRARHGPEVDRAVFRRGFERGRVYAQEREREAEEARASGRSTPASGRSDKEAGMEI